MKTKLMPLVGSIVLLAMLISSCSQSDWETLQTEAVKLYKTSEPSVKTAVGNAAETAVSGVKTQSPIFLTEAARLYETEIAGVTATPQPVDGPDPRVFTIDTDLTITVSVTGKELDSAIASIRPDSPLIGLGESMVVVGQELGINAYYIAAHAAWESSWGTSRLAREKNNLFGYGAYDSCPYECALTFKTKEDCLRQVMTQVKVDYLSAGGKYYHGPTLKGMNVHYATDQNWKNGIAQIMTSLRSFVR